MVLCATQINISRPKGVSILIQTQNHHIGFACLLHPGSHRHNLVFGLIHVNPANGIITARNRLGGSRPCDTSRIGYFGDNRYIFGTLTST